MMELSEEKIREILAQVLDPELNISIVDLGLVYSIILQDKKHVKVIMTLTTIGCPLFNLIEVEVKNKLEEAFGLDQNNITVELTFDPPWSMEKMSENARAMLGI